MIASFFSIILIQDDIPQGADYNSEGASLQMAPPLVSGKAQQIRRAAYGFGDEAGSFVGGPHRPNLSPPGFQALELVLTGCFDDGADVRASFLCVLV